MPATREADTGRVDTDRSSGLTATNIIGVLLVVAGWCLVLGPAGLGIYALARFDYSAEGAIPATLMFLLYMAVPFGIGWLSIFGGRRLRHS
jgi:hypothetical protein